MECVCAGANGHKGQLEVRCTNTMKIANRSSAQRVMMSQKSIMWNKMSADDTPFAFARRQKLLIAIRLDWSRSNVDDPRILEAARRKVSSLKKIKKNWDVARYVSSFFHMSSEGNGSYQNNPLNGESLALRPGIKANGVKRITCVSRKTCLCVCVCFWALFQVQHSFSIK